MNPLGSVRALQEIRVIIIRLMYFGTACHSHV